MPQVVDTAVIRQSSKAKSTALLKLGKLRLPGASLAGLDEQWQQFVHRHLDPLLGSERSRQLNALDVQMTPEEKEINRYLLLAAGNIGIALAATHIFLPLAVVNVGVLIWLGMPVYRRGYRAAVDEHRLTYPVVLAVSEIALIAGGQFVPSSIAMFVVTMTEKVINRTQDHFRRNMIDALGQQPRLVWLVVENAAVQTPLAEIRHGDILLVEAGEMIPVDGVIVAGAAIVDQHRLTGESQPAEKTVGDQVLASTIVLSGKMQVQVQQTGEETSAAQIGVILERVAHSQLTFNSRVENFVDDTTIPMLALGGAALLTMGPAAAGAIMAVGVGTVARFGGPIAMLSYLNVAARHGILIKDARSLELLKEIDTIVFDKTGTLTLEQPQVSRIYVCGWEGPNDSSRPAINEELLLCLAAAAESKQSHPIARAITAAARERGLTVPAIEDAHLEIGYGIKVRMLNSPVAAEQAPDEQTIHVGSRRFLEMEGMQVPAELQAVQENSHAQGHSLVLVAINGMVAGAIELQPTVRPDARQALDKLRARGIDLYIISGDHVAPTRQLAQSLGIQNYHADVLPQAKASLVEQLKAAGRKVCFVGDGINDAIAMGTADVSVSLRGASTLATDTAQIVLMNQNLQQLAFLLQLAHEFDRSLIWLFRATLVPVSAVVASTFLLHTGVYTALLMWQLGVAGGVGLGFLPLRRHRLELDEGSSAPPQTDALA